MEGSKALFTRRSLSHQEHYLSCVVGDEGDGSATVELQCTSGDRSRYSDDGSVFGDEGLAGRSQNECDHEGDDPRADGARGAQSSRSTARSGDSTSRSLAGSDHVDMPVKISKDVAMGFKRRRSESRDFVYKFNWFDALIGVGSILIYFVDVVTDIKLAVDYFLDSKWLYGGVTAALIIGPSLVTCCFGLHWYIIDYRMEKKVMRKNPTANQYLYKTRSKVWFCRFFFTALQFGPVVRTVEYLHYGRKSCSSNLSMKERRRFHWWMLYEDVDNCLLRLFESFLESAPQLTWQLYITIVTSPEDNLIGNTTRALALLSSWGSLAVSLVSYHRSLRNSREDKSKMSLMSVPFYFLWRACETGGRVLCIAMFASAFEVWVFGILLFHWVVASCWLINQRTAFYAHRCLEKVFNIICGYVMLFCFLNLREGHTRYRFLIFYIIFYIENFFMLAFWFRFTLDLGKWFHLWGFIVVLLFFIMHIVFQILYYAFFHPTGNIQNCLSCDKYTFYESVCYDVRPELDDLSGKPDGYHATNMKVSNSLPRHVGVVGASGDARHHADITLTVEAVNRGEQTASRGEHEATHQDRMYRQQPSRGRRKGKGSNGYDI